MSELIPIPKWIADFYDPSKIKPHYTVEVTEDGFMLHEIDLKSFNPYTFQLWELEKRSKLTGKVITVKGSLEDLYDWSRAHDARPIGTPGSRFAEILAADPNYKVPMVFGFPSTSISSACEVASTYKDFLKIVEDFEKNPTNSVIAFKFIDNHPMYWHFAKQEKRLILRRRGSETADNDTSVRAERIILVTGRGWSRVELEIIQGQFSFETSGTPFHTQTNYHDYGLDVYSTSMDDGICELAANIHATYDLEGNLRNGNEEPNGQK